MGNTTQIDIMCYVIVMCIRTLWIEFSLLHLDYNTECYNHSVFNLPFKCTVPSMHNILQV